MTTTPSAPTPPPAPDLNALAAKVNAWIENHVWNLNTLFEIILIASCFVSGMIFARLLRQPVNGLIERSNLPLRAKRVAKVSRRLIFPASTLVLLFAVTKISELPVFGLDSAVMVGVMKVLLAWIIIRLCLQIVDNAILRSTFFWVIWIVAALSIFGILDETTQTLDALGFDFGESRISVLEITKSIIIILILLYLALFASTFFERKILMAKNLTRSSQVLIVKIIRLALVIFAILLGITSAGIDLSVFAVFSGAIGLGIGFGLQRSVSNLFSGLLLLMDQSVKPGDVIELDNTGTYGWVNKMAARYTEVVTRDNRSYLIPNEDFITQRVVNWSHGNSLIRLEVSFGVHYDSDPHKVIKIALATVEKLKGQRIEREPAPVCFLRAFGESSIDFTLRFWITDAEHGITNVKGMVLLALWDAFKEHGIKIPYPHREVFMHND